MILNRLYELAGTVDPGRERTLPRILWVWAGHDEDGSLSFLLTQSGTTVEVFARAVEPFIDDRLDEDRRLLTHTIMETRMRPVMGADLISGLCNNPDHRITRTLRSAGVDITALAICAKHAGYDARRGLFRHEGKPARNDGILLRYGRDLTALAEKGEFDDLSDRPDEIARIYDVLLRKRKRNAMLTGPAGVGKTALVELLARHIVRKCVPARLEGARIYEIGMGGLLAGTRYRGMFEERMSAVMETLAACQPAVLFIDEAHLLQGAGRAEGAPMDAANMLKPILGESRVSIIGATTTGEYHRHIARDPALARRFQEIRIEEPDSAATLAILQRHARTLETHHGIRIGADVLPEVLRAAERHLQNRTQPDKSVDLLESAAVLVERESRREIAVHDVYRVLARRTGRMMSALGEGGIRDLRGLEAALNTRVIGQGEAVRRIVSTLVSRRYGDAAPGKPLGTFLFSGATGVGKTELARSLALEYFGSARDFLHIDLAEYGAADGVHKLIGTPYGPASGTAEGIVIRWLQERGGGVLLFDEIEKAHPDIHRLLMGLLDEGRITSGLGERYDLSRCVVILTTNVLTPNDIRSVKLGFAPSQNRADPFLLMSKYFPEEVLGRLDEIIIFRTPAAQEFRRILGRTLDKAIDRLRDKGVDLVCDRKRLIDQMLAGMEEPRAGARDMVRLVERKLVQPIARRLLDFDGEERVRIELTESFFRFGIIGSAALKIGGQAPRPGFGSRVPGDPRGFARLVAGRGSGHEGERETGNEETVLTRNPPVPDPPPGNEGKPESVSEAP